MSPPRRVEVFDDLPFMASAASGPADAAGTCFAAKLFFCDFICLYRRLLTGGAGVSTG